MCNLANWNEIITPDNNSLCYFFTGNGFLLIWQQWNKNERPNIKGAGIHIQFKLSRNKESVSQTWATKAAKITATITLYSTNWGPQTPEILYSLIQLFMIHFNRFKYLNRKNNNVLGSWGTSVKSTQFGMCSFNRCKYLLRSCLPWLLSYTVTAAGAPFLLSFIKP